LEDVQPFLFNLFSDPAIIRLSAFLRLPLAKVISWHRARVARNIYRRIGGGSPLLTNTEAQARALELTLGPDHRCFVAMRYWHPSSAETAREVAEWEPEDIVCLPLYPQFSTTTTGSSLASWRAAARRAGIAHPARIVCCYPSNDGFAETVAELIRPVLDSTVNFERPPRLLLTAHGLPMTIVRAGDPYPGQVETTATAIISALERPGIDWRVCYQSRVGPVGWIGPATDDEIRRAGRDRIPLIVAPISFVSEHSETLVELDLDYRDLAEASGVPSYYRIPTVGTEPRFIRSLASLVHRAIKDDRVGSCPSHQSWCALAGARD
jgi:ferrochelatase